MDLKITDVAKLLGVPEQTIQKWLDEGKIPSYKLQEETRFSLEEIESWMMSNQLPSNQLLKPASQQSFALFRAIYHGGVYSLKASNKNEAITMGAQLAASKLDLDGDVVADLLLERESMMPTSLNNGIAIPHTRECVLPTGNDLVLVVFLETPVEYGALDEKPVHTLFFLFASDDKRHLNLLAKIAHLSSKEEMLNFLQTRPSESKTLEVIKEFESALQAPVSV